MRPWLRRFALSIGHAGCGRATSAQAERVSPPIRKGVLFADDLPAGRWVLVICYRGLDPSTPAYSVRQCDEQGKPILGQLRFHDFIAAMSHASCLARESQCDVRLHELVLTSICQMTV